MGRTIPGKLYVDFDTIETPAQNMQWESLIRARMPYTGNQFHIKFMTLKRCATTSRMKCSLILIQ